MKKILSFILISLFVVNFVPAKSTSAASSSVYYAVPGTAKVAPGIYQGTPNGKSKIVLKEQAFTLKEVSKPPMNLYMTNYYVNDRVAKGEDFNEWLLNKSPIQEVQNVGKELYYAKFSFSTAYFGGTCGGGGADLLEIYRKDSKGKISKLSNDKISNDVANLFSIKGSYIYYAKAVDDVFRNFSIVKSSLNGKNKQTLKKGVDDFWVNGNTIYYISKQELYKMDLNGKSNKKISALKSKLYGNSPCNGGNYYVSKNGISVDEYSNDGPVNYYLDFSSGKVTKLDNLKIKEELSTLFDVNVKKKLMVWSTWDGRKSSLNIYDFKGKLIKKLGPLEWNNVRSIDAKKGEYIYVEGSQLKLKKF